MAVSNRRNLIEETPEYIWSALGPYRQRAEAAFPGGVIDLSIGSPVDDVPALIRGAVAAASNAPGYPTAASTPALRRAIVDWYARRRGVALDESNVLATNGSKEFISLLPFWLGLGSGDVVVQPRVHYPNYAEGAGLVGARVHSGSDPDDWPEDAALIWLNSPGNPDGVVNDVDYLRHAVARARQIGALIVQDECYIELGWDGPWAAEPIPSILDPRVVDGDVSGVLSCYSLSKQSNLAGYRAAVAAGDPHIIAGLINVRKTAGLSVNSLVQAGIAAALGDDVHVAAQKERYRGRRDKLKAAVASTNLTIESSLAGLYLWCTEGKDAWETVGWFADRGILVAPGHFYGAAAGQHVRLALTATDADIDAVVSRLSALM